MKNKRFKTRLFLTVAFVIIAAPASAAPITFNTALPLSAKEWVARELLIYRQNENSAVDVDAFTALSVLGYGITQDISVFGVIPFTNKERKVTGAPSLDNSGLGDIRLFGRYSAYADDFTGGTFRIAPFAGLELPTGENQERDENGLLSPSLQNGSGATDVFGGVVVTYATLDFNVDGQLAYQSNTEADGVDLGNVFNADLSFQKRLLPDEITSDTTGFLFGNLEINFEHADETEINGINNLNSGGTQVSLTPGVQYATRRWIADFAVQVPIIENLNGTALERDYTLFAGFRTNF